MGTLSAKRAISWGKVRGRVRMEGTPVAVSSSMLPPRAGHEMVPSCCRMVGRRVLRLHTRAAHMHKVL